MPQRANAEGRDPTREGGRAERIRKRCAWLSLVLTGAGHRNRVGKRLGFACTQHSPAQPHASDHKGRCAGPVDTTGGGALRPAPRGSVEEGRKAWTEDTLGLVWLASQGAESRPGYRSYPWHPSILCLGLGPYNQSSALLGREIFAFSCDLTAPPSMEDNTQDRIV